MPLTVADVLKEIPLFSSAQVVAGQKGLHRVIRWTHIVDFPDVEPWVRAGDFLLTTAFALKDNPAMQRELIPSLVQKGLSGMAVAIGRYFCEIPPEMTRSADDLAFPILTIPFEIPFVEITQAIHRRIVTEQYDLLEKSFHIHRVLTQLVLQEGDLGAVAESLAKLINRSVTIEDTSFHLLACAAASPEDDVRKQTISEGRTPEPVVTYLTAQGFFDEIRRNPGPRLLPPIPQLGLTLERIIAPIIVGAQLYGYVWIIAANNPLAELDFQAIESATIVAALIITRQQTIYETEQRLKDSLLNNLIDPDPYHDIASVIETFQKLGLQYGYRVLVLEQVSDKLLDSSRLCALIEAEMRTTEQRLTVIHREQRFIVLLGATEAAQGKDAAERLLQVTKDEGIALAIGIGSFSRQATHVRQCYQQVQEALQIGKTISPGQPGVWVFEDLGFLHWLRSLPSDLQSDNRYYGLIRAMEDYDQKNDSELLKTLEAYLDHLGNSQQAARVLFIHRNTLNQRRGKIEENWDIDLKNSQTLINLIVAIKNWRLSKPN